MYVIMIIISAFSGSPVAAHISVGAEEFDAFFCLMFRAEATRLSDSLEGQKSIQIAN